MICKSMQTDRQTDKGLRISLKWVSAVFAKLTETVDREKVRKLNKERQEWVYLVSHSHMCWPGRRTEREKPFPCVGQFTPNLPRGSLQRRDSSWTPLTRLTRHRTHAFLFLFLVFLSSNLWLLFGVSPARKWMGHEWKSCTVLWSYIYTNQTRHT